MPELQRAPVDLSKIGPGWEANIGSRWGKLLAEPNLLYQFVQPIAPIGDSHFQPTRLLFRHPPELRGTLEVFSIKDVTSWRPPEYSDLMRIPPQPYYPMQVLEAHVDRTARTLEKCEWAHPVTFAAAITPEMIEDKLQRDLYEKLKDSFERLRHTFVERPDSNTDLVFAFHNIPTDQRSLRDRVDEVEPMLVQQVAKEFDFRNEQGNRKINSNTIAVATITEDFSRMSQGEMEDAIWTLLARIGTFKMILIHVDPDTRQAQSYTFATMEAGHSSVRAGGEDDIDQLRDKLVTHACAGLVEKTDKIPDVIPLDDWNASPIPDCIVHVGKELGTLGILEPPVEVKKYTVTEKRAQAIRGVVGWVNQSPGAVIAYDPFIGTFIVTGTGREEVNKLAMRRDGDLVPVRLRDGKVEELGIIGLATVGSSIEANEYTRGLAKVEKIRVRLVKDEVEGDYFLEDPDGEYELPKWRAILHTHMGVQVVLPFPVNGGFRHVVRHIPQNLTRFPHGIGCGKKAMDELSEDAMERIDQEFGDDQEALVAILDKGNHGTDFVVKTAPIPGTNRIPIDPFYMLLRLFKEGYIRTEKRLPRF